MPPKQQQKASSSKVKDDKTFGLKNVSPYPNATPSNLMILSSQKNKSARVQKDIARIQTEQSRVGKNKQEVCGVTSAQGIINNLYYR